MSKLAFNATAWRDDEHCCLAYVDASGRVLRTSAISCAWDGDARFDAWFRKHWPSVLIVADGGSGFYEALSGVFVRTVRASEALPSR